MVTSSSEGRLLADFHNGLDWLPVHLAESYKTCLGSSSENMYPVWWAWLLDRHFSPLSVSAPILVSALVLPILTYVISSWRFQLAIAAGSKQHGGCAAPPVVPYWDIFLGHFCDLAWNTKGFILRTIEMGRKSPVMVSAGFSKFFVVSSPEQVQKVFRSCKQLSNKHMVVVTLQNLFGATKEVGALFDDVEIDDVELDASPEHPMETSTTTTATASTGADNAEAQSAESPAAPRRQNAVKRLKEHVVGLRGSAQDFLSGTYLDALSERYLANLAQATTLPNFQSCGGGGGGVARKDDEWTHYPDLYTFLQSLVSPATIEALMGAKIFEINPRIVDDFWEFERASPLFIRGLPRWLMPSKYRARDRIFDTMKKLDDLATQGGVGRLLPDDPDWEPYLGSKFLRARHDFTHFVRPYSANIKAWEKMGILFGSTANLVPTMFWYIFEALKDSHLRDRLLAEILSCVTPSSYDQTGSHRGDIRYDKVLQKPLLQSAYAETLRMRVAIALPRTCENGDFDISGYRIEQNKHIMIFTWPVMRDDDAWSRAGKPPTVPLDEFWAERFLVPKQPKQPKHPSPSSVFPVRPPISHDEETRYEAKSSSPDYEFSVRGLAGRWMPYGGGQHLCPGRHYAKIQILGTFAFLFRNYEIELLDSSKSRGTKMDMKWFPTGALPPDRKVPFKMRKRQDNNV